MVATMDDKKIWYVKQHGKTTGPYPAGLIRRFVLLARISDSSEVSHDGEQWQALSSCPDLIPEVMKVDRDDPVAQERLLRAKRWADERYGNDRRVPEEVGSQSGAERRHRHDRREQEPPELDRARGARIKHKLARGRRESYLPAIVVIIGAIAIVASYLVYYKPAPPQNLADCNALPGPGVNWSSCQMEGITLPKADLTGANMSNGDFSGGDFHASAMKNANLAYSVLSIADLRGVDLTGASLKGVSLRKADLAHANLTNADLSYADMQGANLTDASLKGAILDNAIWVDRNVCAPGSIGRCIVAASAN